MGGHSSMNNESEGLHERVDELMGAEKWSEAIGLIEKSNLCEADARLSWNLGWAYFKLENWRLAENHLSRTTTLDPKLAAGWWALGAAQEEAGNLVEAEQNVKKALSLRESTICRILLALILMTREDS